MNRIVCCFIIWTLCFIWICIRKKILSGKRRLKLNKYWSKGASTFRTRVRFDSFSISGHCQIIPIIFVNTHSLLNKLTTGYFSKDISFLRLSLKIVMAILPIGKFSVNYFPWLFFLSIWNSQEPAYVPYSQACVPSLEVLQMLGAF